MKTRGHDISAVSISKILKEEGFAKLPRRDDEERPRRIGPSAAPVSDVRQLDLTTRKFRTRFGGLFLFLPFLARIPWPELMDQAGFPGSKMVPAEHAIRSLMALKLFGSDGGVNDLMGISSFFSGFNLTLFLRDQLSILIRRGVVCLTIQIFPKWMCARF